MALSARPVLRGRTDRPHLDSPTRVRDWTTYTRPPSSTHHAIRGAELNRTVDLLNPQPGDRIVEYGCGHGALTDLLAEAVKAEGEIIALDVNRQLTTTLQGRHPNVQVVHLNSPQIPIAGSSADGVVSIATMHHVPVSDQPVLFKEFDRILRPGKPLVVADVAKRTKVAEYFDTEVDKTSRAGHKFPFLDMRDFAALAASSRLDLRQWEIENVPWVFRDIDQAGRFLRDMHDATVPPMECLREAGRILGVHATNKPGEAPLLILGWQLFFAKAVKRV